MLKELLSGLALGVLASSSAIAAPTERSDGQGLVTPLAACTGNTQTQTFVGGYIFTRLCGNTYVSGIGSTIDAANANVSGWASLIDQGNSCMKGSTPVQSFAGGFRTDYQCMNGRLPGGLGTTATDAANNALSIATLTVAAPGTGLSCRGDSSSPFQAHPGGFTVQYQCTANPGVFISYINGAGSTITDAANVAYRFMELAAAGGPACTSPQITVNGLVFQVSFSCNGVIRTGYGSTITAAANDAAAQAGA